MLNLYNSLSIWLPVVAVMNKSLLKLCLVADLFLFIRYETISLFQENSALFHLSWIMSSYFYFKRTEIDRVFCLFRYYSIILLLYNYNNDIIPLKSYMKVLHKYCMKANIHIRRGNYVTWGKPGENSATVGLISTQQN